MEKDINEIIKEKNLKVAEIHPDVEPDRNKFVNDSTQLRMYKGIILTKEEFEKACKVAGIVQNDSKVKEAKGYEIEDYAHDIWINSMMATFSFETKSERLQLKPGISEQNVPFHCWAARFQQKRPFIYLLVQNDGKVVVTDEKTFDAFDHGPFEKPTI
jgi:hypothetical protein